jgi:K319-like protein
LFSTCFSRYDRCGSDRSGLGHSSCEVKGRIALNRQCIEGLTKVFSVLAFALTSASCGGGSSPPPPPPPPPPANVAPTADAGADQSVVELTVVNLAGLGADANGDTLSFAWIQTGGSTVTLNTPDLADASFTAPDVAPGAPEILVFELTVTDPAGLSSTDTVAITVAEPAPVVTISGTLSYEFALPNANCLGLNLDNPVPRPIRQATVQLLDMAGTTLIASIVTDDTGAYSFTLDGSTDFILRVRAELKSASWDVEVRNNVDTSATPPPLAQRPLYTMSQAFNSGAADNPNMNLIATTGWGGNSYTGPRVAAPFAILDTIYAAMKFVDAEDPGVNFVPLDAFWSVNNKILSPNNINLGDLPTSFYNTSIDSLFLLGTAGQDTEEFDDHVVLHEWGHYFEDNFSRSDSRGGAHGQGDFVDMRLAFGEGWASALAAMALNEPRYCDTTTSTSGGGFNSESTSVGTNGWYNELTVIRLIYDLWDTINDGVDNSSIGFGPIYAVMTGSEATTPAFTSIFTFATYLLQQGTGQETFINTLLTDSGINPTGIDIWGSTEQNDGPGVNADVFPLYTPLTLGVTETICVNSQFDSGRTGNKLSEHRYLRLNLATPTQVTFTMATNPAPSQPTVGFDCTADPNDPENSQHSDPDFLVSRGGLFFADGRGCEPNSEVVTTGGVLSAGEYLVDLNEFRHADENSPSVFPEQVCFDFTAN